MRRSILIAVAVIVLLGAYAYWARNHSRGDVRAWPTPAWAGVNTDSGLMIVVNELQPPGYFIHLRDPQILAMVPVPSAETAASESTSGGLFDVGDRSMPGGDARGYFYDTIKDSVSMVIREPKGSGLNLPCSQNDVRNRRDIEIDYYKNRIVSGKKALPISGPTLIAADSSYDLKRLAVVTSTGARRRLVNILSSPQYVPGTGQHWIQFFSIPEGAPIGKPVGLPFQSPLDISWTCDNKYIVCCQRDRTKLCVIPAPSNSSSR